MQFAFRVQTFIYFKRTEAISGIAEFVLRVYSKLNTEQQLYLLNSSNLVGMGRCGRSNDVHDRRCLLLLFLAILPLFVFLYSKIDDSCRGWFVSLFLPPTGDALPAGSTPFLSAYPGPSSLNSDPSYRSANPSTLQMAHLWASHAHEGNTFFFKLRSPYTFNVSCCQVASANQELRYTTCTTV